MPALPFTRIEFWSATPTPFLEDFTLDREAVRRLVEQHVAFGAHGIMLGGTCGEGPWLPMELLDELTRVAVESAGGRLKISVQVTDNSALQMLARAEQAREAGADYIVIAQPRFLLKSAPARQVRDICVETVRKSPLPVGYYEFGDRASHPLAEEYLPELLGEPNLLLVKDSSGSLSRRTLFLAAAKERAELRLFTGNEFDTISSLEAGYHGSMLGGGIFNTSLTRRIATAVTEGRAEEAAALQARMNDLMHRVYGESIQCWMSGLKYLLVGMGLFGTRASLLDFPLTDACKAAIDEILTGPDRDGFRCDLFPNR